MSRFSDQQLVLILQKAARIVSSDLYLTGDNVIIVDASGSITSPQDDSQIEALVLMQAECLISQRDYSLDLSAGTIGISVKDGEQSIDTTQRAGSRASFFNSKYSPCAQYDRRITLARIDRNTNGKLIW